MKRGRPVKSQIRQNVIEILNYLKKGYGYAIYQTYVQVFPKATMRSIYYHLKKGVSLGEFEIDSVEKSKGRYSWGEIAEKVFYKLGPNAAPKGEERVRLLLEKKIK